MLIKGILRTFNSSEEKVTVTTNRDLVNVLDVTLNQTLQWFRQPLDRKTNAPLDFSKFYSIFIITSPILATFTNIRTGTAILLRAWSW